MPESKQGHAAAMNADATGVEQRIIRTVMPELDTTRGLAILLVFSFHGFQFFTPTSTGVPPWERIFLAAAGQGWSGVNLFFVLSGFLITGILLDSVNKSNYYSRFYYRRALRILPAYYLLLLFLLVLGHITFMPRHTSIAFVGLSFIYLSNVTPLLGVPMQYGPLWSLAVEEHFYILWPTAVRTLTKCNLIVVASLICVIEPFVRVYAVYRGGLWWGPYTWVSADGLALGGLLAVFGRSSHASRTNLLKLVILAAAGAIAAMAVSMVVPRFVAIGIRGTCVNYFAFATVGLILWLGTGAYRGLVNLRILSFFGYISYGLYLIHVLCLDFYNGAVEQFIPSLSVGTSFAKCCLRFVIAMAVAAGIAYLSRITYEEFFLQMKDKSLKARESIHSPAQCNL
jgi:peptidoglycan/LPS O-acetylase OafA/YrhL